METTTFELQGKPYFILESENGIFYMVSSLKLKERNMSANLNLDLGNLELGLDLIEVSTRGISLMVKTPKGVNTYPYVVEELKKLASIADMDYFSCERFGAALFQPVISELSREIYEVKPRLFRKLVND